jgi:hypothetical protein
MSASYARKKLFIPDSHLLSLNIPDQDYNEIEGGVETL